MNEAKIPEIVESLFKKYFLLVRDYLSESMGISPKFIFPPNGLYVSVDAKTVLEITFSVAPNEIPLISSGEFVDDLKLNHEAVCTCLDSDHGPILAIETAELVSEANSARIPTEVLLEILVLHEMVHICMIGNCDVVFKSGFPKKRYRNWIANPKYLYIHEAVALHVSEKLIPKVLNLESGKYIDNYLSHIKLTAEARKEKGQYYLPYFELRSDKSESPRDFWAKLCPDQQDVDIFSLVEVPLPVS